MPQSQTKLVQLKAEARMRRPTLEGGWGIAASEKMVRPSLKENWNMDDLKQKWSAPALNKLAASKTLKEKMERPSLKQRWTTAGRRRKNGTLSLYPRSCNKNGTLRPRARPAEQCKAAAKTLHSL